MRIARKKETADMDASFSTPAFHLDHLRGYSVCAAWTETVATLSGTIKLQASNNAFVYEKPSVSGEDLIESLTENPSATWADIAGSSVAVSGSGSQFWNVSDSFYSAFRVTFTNTGGEGTFAAYVHAQGDS